MLLRKRQRPPIKRTTSMTEFSLDLNINMNDPPVAAIALNNFHQPSNGDMVDQRLLTRRNSADSVETAHFLRACSLCKRHLIPGRDIYMYRGDSAFCSLECRQQQMSKDERKDKCSLVKSRKKFTNAAVIAAVAGDTGSHAPPQARP